MTHVLSVRLADASAPALSFSLPKNFSLLHKGGAITLAPLYDLLETVLYPELSPRLAMKIGGNPGLTTLRRAIGIGLPPMRSSVRHACGRGCGKSVMPLAARLMAISAFRFQARRTFRKFEPPFASAR